MDRPTKEELKNWKDELARRAEEMRKRQERDKAVEKTDWQSISQEQADMDDL